MKYMMWIMNKSPLKGKAYVDLMKKKLSGSFDSGTELKRFNKRKDADEEKHMDEIRATKAYKYLTWSKVKEYLGAYPQRQIELHDELYKHIHGNDGKITAIELETIRKIFDYGYYIDGDAETAYKIAALMDTNTCCYCNRLYTLTIDNINAESGEKTHLVRPTFDHWFPQNKYPDLALSYYNLIPSCTLCNSSLKHDNTDMSLDKFIHPYVDEDCGFRFTYRPLSNGNKVEYAFKVADKAYQQKVINTLNLFKTIEIYDAHAPLELQDLLDLAQEYPGDYIEQLITTVMSDLDISENDTYRAVFGIEIDQRHHADRPFSKFKSDIIAEIKCKTKKAKKESL